MKQLFFLSLLGLLIVSCNKNESSNIIEDETIYNLSLSLSASGSGFSEVKTKANYVPLSYAKVGVYSKTTNQLVSQTNHDLSIENKIVLPLTTGSYEIGIIAAKDNEIFNSDFVIDNSVLLGKVPYLNNYGYDIYWDSLWYYTNKYGTHNSSEMNQLENTFYKLINIDINQNTQSDSLIYMDRLFGKTEIQFSDYEKAPLGHYFTIHVDTLYYSEYFRLDNGTYSNDLHYKFLGGGWNNDEFPSSVFIYSLQYATDLYNDNSLTLETYDGNSTSKSLLTGIKFEKGTHIVYRGKAFEDNQTQFGLYGNTEWILDTIQF